MVETVEVVFDIPLYAYNLLDTDMGVELTLGCCTVVNERDVESRVKSWKRPGTVGLNTRTPALKTLCKQMLGLGLEQPVRVRFEKKHWPFIVMLTERLGITVAEWLLGGVGYAVWLKERTVQTLGMEGRVSK